MQSYCKSTSNADRRSPGLRRALTLLELVVVLAILVVLSGMVVPLIEGLGHQTNASTNATVVSDVNRAVSTYATRFEKFPDGWDSLLNSTDQNLFLKLHSTLGPGTNALLQTSLPLTLTQVDSLSTAGIMNVFDAVETGTGTSPNQFVPVSRKLADGGKVATFTNAATEGAYANSKFCLQHLEAIDKTNTNHQYVVFGLGGMTTIRGVMTRDVPLISSADPTQTYARMLCVFMIPSATATTGFPAKYVGCFLPDGTSQRMNMDKYNNSTAN